MRMLETYRALQREMDKYESPVVTIKDFVYFWNNSIDEFSDIKHVKGADSLQADHDDIKSLLSDPTDISFGSGSTATLPDLYRNFMDLKVTLKLSKAKGKYLKDGLIVTHPSKDRSARTGYIEENAYQTAKLKRCWYSIHKNTITLDIDPDTTIQSAVLRFYEKPTVMNLSSTYADMSAEDQALEVNNTTQQFPDHTVKKIIKVCRRIMLENIESGRYNTILNENNLTVK
jgi:hypothetical protein